MCYMCLLLQVMCLYLSCTLIWVGVTLLPDLYDVSMTHIGIWAALLCFVLVEGYGPMSGASMSAARTFSYFVAGGFTAARGMRQLFYLLISVLRASAECCKGIIFPHRLLVCLSVRHLDFVNSMT